VPEVLTALQFNHAAVNNLLVVLLLTLVITNKEASLVIEQCTFFVSQKRGEVSLPRPEARVPGEYCSQLGLQILGLLQRGEF